MTYAPHSPFRTTDRELLLSRVFSVMRALIRSRYFSFEVEGLEHLPREGPVVYAQNHAGWFALDAFFVALAVSEAGGLKRTPHFVAHDSVVAAPLLGKFLRRLGAVSASSLRHPELLPPEVESYGICPEGVQGNCKPFWEAYRMHRWARGFVRLASARHAPVVPVAVFGGEECLPVAWTVRFLEPLIGSIVGLPLSPVPLPARWKVVFHEPVHVPDRALTDPSLCSEVAERIQHTVQDTLDRHSPGHALSLLSSTVAALRAAGPRLLSPPISTEGFPTARPFSDNAGVRPPYADSYPNRASASLTALLMSPR
jgi:1-acyl-sn-glycerol-3-phosphate acyltransferase